MKTKEEILIDNGIKYGVLNANGKQQMLKEMVQDGAGPEGISMLQAMQEYADQEMLNLLSWIITRNIKIRCNEFTIKGRGLLYSEIIDQYKKEVENETH